MERALQSFSKIFIRNFYATHKPYSNPFDYKNRFGTRERNGFRERERERILSENVRLAKFTRNLE